MSRPANFGPGGWVNGNHYQRTKEVFGILPVAKARADQLGMHPYNSNYATKKPIKHQYLAAQQNTLVAVIPVHTKVERALFHGLVADNQGLFSGTQPPKWETVAVTWNQHADGQAIFYKVSTSGQCYRYDRIFTGLYRMQSI